MKRIPTDVSIPTPLFGGYRLLLALPCSDSYMLNTFSHLIRMLGRDAALDATELKDLQAPIKARYCDKPETAVITLTAEGAIGDGVTCSVETGRALVEAGLHPATGGSGLHACSGDMLLQALVACAGVTLNAVATALELDVRDARIRAEGDLDFKGTLGVDAQASVGFRQIRLSFDIEGELADDQLATLMKLTERYCVVYQTLRSHPAIEVTVQRA